MFDVGWFGMVVVLLVGLFIFGPDKLPKAISDGVRFIRNIRAMAANATSDLSREIGRDITIEDLHPKTFIRKHVLSESDQALFRGQAEGLRQQFNDAVRAPLDDAVRGLNGVPDRGTSSPADPAQSGTSAPVSQQPRRPRFDADAT